MNRERLKELLEMMSTKRILVIGDMMLDEYIFGMVDRISPEAPVPIVNVENETYVLGGAANVANNLHSLGVNVSCFGIIGNDANGEKLKNEFAKKSVNTEGVLVDNFRPTIVKKRVLAGNQQLLRIDWESKQKINSFIEDEFISLFRKEITKIDGIILSDYDKGILTPRLSAEIIKIARENGKIIVADPKPHNVKNYAGATGITPNTKEARESIEYLLGEKILIENENDFENMGNNLKKLLNLTSLLITRSEKGMSIYSDKGNVSIPTYAAEVYDVTGAGDTVISMFTLMLASGADYEEAAKVANIAAGVVVGKVGTATATIDEIIKYYDMHLEVR